MDERKLAKRQRIQVGLPHAGKAAEITTEADTYQVTVEDGIALTAPRHHQPRHQTAQSLELRSGQLAPPLRELPRVTLQGTAQRRRALPK
jgi:hypothetical protein